jgi:hypothetical protein
MDKRGRNGATIAHLQAVFTFVRFIAPVAPIIRRLVNSKPKTAFSTIHSGRVGLKAAMVVSPLGLWSLAIGNVFAENSLPRSGRSTALIAFTPDTSVTVRLLRRGLRSMIKGWFRQMLRFISRRLRLDAWFERYKTTARRGTKNAQRH